MTPDDDDAHYWTKLARYFSGEMSSDERNELESWLGADPSRREEVVAARILWDQAGRLPSSNRIDAMWGDLVRRIRSHHPSKPVTTFRVVSARNASHGGPRARSWLHRSRAYLAAASVVVLLSAGVLWRTLSQGSDNGVEPSLYSTQRGETRTLRLADGSTVHLGPESRLTVEKFESDGPRRLELVGEAVFVVEHDEDRPFYVSAGLAVTEDLGTEFGVRAYPSDGEVRVAVTEGRVALRPRTAPDHSGTVLVEGQLGRLDNSGRIAVDADPDVSQQLAWVEGRVFYKQAPLSVVAAELARRYDAKIELADSGIGERKITVDLPAGSLPHVLEAVVVPLNLRYERQGEVYRLTP